MKFRGTIAWLLALVVLYGCSSVRVSSDFDPQVDFATIHGYGWQQRQDLPDALADEPLLYKRIQAAIDRYLASRGYQRVEPSQADVLLTIRGISKEKMRVTNRTVPTPYYRYRYDPVWVHPGYENRIDVSYYTEGTLVIDMYSPGSGELIWRGVGSGILREHQNREKQDQTIDLYVRRILDQFPPGSSHARTP